MAAKHQRTFVDPTGYNGPMRFLEVMIGGKHRAGSGIWAEATELATMVYDAAFVTRKPFNDSHGQIAHYSRSFDLFDKKDDERKAELFAQLDTIPHLADFHIDIDYSGDLAASQDEAIRLVDYYLSLGVPEAALGIRFSGKKGFDVMVPWQCLGVKSQGVIGLNWTTYKLLAAEVKGKLGLAGIDMGLYRRNGTIRLENTVHPSGLCKVRLTPDELRGSLDSILGHAAQPRKPLYSAEAEVDARSTPVVGLRSLYLVAQARADREIIEVAALRNQPLDSETLDALKDGLTACLVHIPERAGGRGTRNETLFHAAMMLKHIGRDEAEARAYGQDWLGRGQYAEVGGDSTVRSVYSGPYSGGCRWMREHGFASEAECRVCPIGMRRYEREARVVEEPPTAVAFEPELPTLAEQRERLWRDFQSLSPHRLTVIRTVAGGGKAQPLDAKLLTPTGWRRMGEVEVGDEVIGANGKPTKVMAIYPQGRVPIYRVTFTDGAATEVCGDHLWLTQTVSDRNAWHNGRKGHGGRPGTVKSTLEIADTLMFKGKRNHTIPMVGVVEFASRPVPLDPYLLGVLLGDGCIRDDVTITCKKNLDIMLRLGNRLPEGVAASHYADGQSIGFIGPGGGRPNPIREILRELGLLGKGSSDKFVPDLYLINDANVRLEVLRGLLDTDGTVSSRSGSLSFSSTSPHLADAVDFLVGSFGGTTSRSSRFPHYTGPDGRRKRGRLCYRVGISFPPDIRPLTTRSKASRLIPHNKYPPRRFIDSVELVGEKEAQCITVEAKDGLYITDDFIVTHNTWVALRRATELVAEGKRVLFFVKDTKKADGLAADLINELRENHQYGGKVQVLYGRNEDNCEDWPNAEKVAKKGHSVGKVLCASCFARHYCGYYAQYDYAYEPGIYVAPHAMLPIIFDDERRGFSKEFMTHKDEEGSEVLGGPLALIVIDEDAMDSLIDRFFVGSYHLQAELKQEKRLQPTPDKLLGKTYAKTVKLDGGWLRVVEWLRSAIKVPGPLMPALNSVAAADGHHLGNTLDAINPALMIDPDWKLNKGHKPFTVKLYQALLREWPRLKDGNFTIWATGTGLELLSMSEVRFPANVPVAVLDAYASEDVYRRYFRAAGVNRLPVFLDYPVREQANVTYVLGANLLKSDFVSAAAGKPWAVNKIERVMLALRELTSDGVETYVVAKRDFFESDTWRRWEPELPNCVADGDAGVLYFWRGRGINAAAGKRVAVLQVPNFHPNSVLAEASVLFADEPRLDDQRVRVESELVWSKDAENPRRIMVDRTVYADERLNLINERYRMDELVQMALRSRSLTTGAEIMIFADLPDPRLPATRVVTVSELVDDEAKLAPESRRIVMDALRELGELSMENLVALGVVTGEPSATPLRRVIKDAHPDALRISREYPVAPSEVAL